MGASEGKYISDEGHYDPENERVTQNMVEDAEQADYTHEKPQLIEMIAPQPTQEPVKGVALQEKLVLNMTAEPVGKPKAYDELKIERTHRAPIEEKENDNQEIEEVVAGYLEGDLPLPKKQVAASSEHPLRMCPAT